MQDRRRYKRVSYFATNEFAEESVLRSWRNAITRQEYNTSFEIKKEKVCIDQTNNTTSL